MNYVLMGITCVVFVYILYRMGKSHTKECNDDITYNYRPKISTSSKRYKRR